MTKMMIVQLAWRYLHARYINYVAIAAVALALTVQIVVMAVLDGTILNMQKRATDVLEHMTVRFYHELPTQKQLESYQQSIDSLDGVRGSSVLIQQYSIAKGKQGFMPLYVYGIDLAQEARVRDFTQYLLDIKFDPENPSWHGEHTQGATAAPVFLGIGVAEKLRVTIGDHITIIYSDDPNGGSQRSKRFIVSSILQTGSYYIDQNAALVPLFAAQELFVEEGGDRIQTVAIYVEQPNIFIGHDNDAAQGQALRARVESLYAEHVMPQLSAKTEAYTSTWAELWRRQIAGMKHENNLQELIMLLMNLSGGFCVFAILSTLVSQRVRDIGLLRCLGMSRLRVCSLFLLLGLMIGVIGGVIGVISGYVLSPRIDDLFHFFTGEYLYPPRMFGIQDLQVVINPDNIILYFCGALVITLLASLYPAWWASRRQPVEALRDE